MPPLCVLQSKLEELSVKGIQQRVVMNMHVRHWQRHVILSGPVDHLP